MFSLYRNKLSKPLVMSTKRSFQTNGVNNSSFDRMLLDKLSWARGAFAGGFIFALFGVGSVLGYGLSHLMEK